MAVRGGWCGSLERAARTMFFIMVMLASLLVQCLPVLVAIGDVLVPCILISYFTCMRCHEFKQHLRRYSFKRSLVDIPLVSAIRSLIITCFYIICDGRAVSNGSYLGSVSFCSIFSVILLSIKTCVFSVNSHIEAEAWHTPLSRKLHIKNSWGMPVLFLSSIVFALGHMVIAYWTSYKASRKLLFHCVDPIVVFSSKSMVSALQKVPRSPTPTNKASIFDVQLLSDTDSLFITCKGYVLHYKLSTPNNSWKHQQPSKNQHNLLSSNQFHQSSSYDPLLDSTTSHSDLIPLDLDLEANDECGIVLVHGFGGGVFSWRHVMGKLAQQVGCRVAAFDRPGWGFSLRPQRKDWEEKEWPNPYKLDTQVDLLISFCMEMRFSSVILIGHDDGGVLVLKAAERVQRSWPSINISIKALVLLSVSLSRDVVPSFARLLLRTSLGKKNLIHPLLRTEITQVVNRRAWSNAANLTTEILGLYKAPLCIEGWDEALQEISKLPCETVFSAQKASTLLQSIEKLPVLVIAGAEDKLVSLQSAQAMASKLVNGRLVAVSGCGHLPHEECPKALLAAVCPFISRLLGFENSV